MRLLDHAELFADNRARFMRALGEDAALLFAAPHHLRNGDAEYRYRQQSDVVYLAGWEGPEAALLFRPGADQPFIMFVQPKNKEREIWTGRRPGPVGAKDDYGADEAFDIDELWKQLPDLLQGYRNLHYRFADDADRDRKLVQSLSKARRKARKNGLDVPDAFIDPGRVLHGLRLIKTEAELVLMRQAAEITVDAHIQAMAMTGPGVMEYELEAEIDGTFRRRGGNGPGYTTIVGGGVNATILHYIENQDPLLDGTLVCVDAGCEYAYYTADVTRTWPVGGRFTEPQRQLYQVVLDAQLAAIDAVRPGNTWAQVHDVATRVLTEGMVRLGLLEGDPDDPEHIATLIEDGKQRKYYMHGTGHWLGMDVHDVGAYAGGGTPTVLAPGMVMTVEPGLYVAEDDEDAPEGFRGIGIRIEDDIVCTEGDPEVLTDRAPKTIEEVEAAVLGRERASQAV